MTVNMLEREIKECEIKVHAGPHGENSDVYAWVQSNSMPSWVSSVDDPAYRLHTSKALQTAKEIVRETGHDIELKMHIQYTK